LADDFAALGMMVSLSGGVTLLLANGWVVGYGWDFGPADDEKRACISGIWYGDFRAADVGAEFRREGVVLNFADEAGSPAIPG
jgi:hypothetical protein